MPLRRIAPSSSSIAAPQQDLLQLFQFERVSRQDSLWTRKGTLPSGISPWVLRSGGYSRSEAKAT